MILPHNLLKLFSRNDRSLGLNSIWIFLLGLGLGWVGVGILPSGAIGLQESSSRSENFANIDPDLGQTYYEAGQFEDAVQTWRRQTETLPPGIEKARLFINLALAYYHLGQVEESNASLHQGFDLLNHLEPHLTTRTFAQAWNTQGILWSNQGQFQEAVTAFQRAELYYQQLTNTSHNLDRESGIIQSQINQALALQSLGFYRKALTLLNTLKDRLSKTPNSHLTVVGLRSLGETLDTIGSSDEAEIALKESLATAEQLGLSQEISASQQSLATFYHGQWRRLGGEAPKLYADATNYYEQAIDTAQSPLTIAQITANLFRLKVDAQGRTSTLEADLMALLPSLPLSRETVYVQLNFAESLIHQINNSKQGQRVGLEKVLPWLTKAAQQSQTLGDKASQAQALGNLGRVYELAEQWSDARRLTEQALDLSQQDQTNAMTYQWQWQLGRILRQQSLLLKGQGRSEQAAATLENARTSYMSAIQTLKGLRGDLVSLSPTSRLDFREATEPLYREAVSLWLETAKTNPNAREKEEQLQQAQSLIESLQVEELVNFFRADCVGNLQTTVDQTLNDREALIYPILLDDRLEILLSRAGQPLEQYTVEVDRQTIEATVTQFRLALSPSQSSRARGRSGSQVLALNAVDPTPLAQDLYQWLIEPLAKSLTTTNTDTLIFVLDGSLRNIPMAALYDGSHYLIENYAVTMAPGLQLIDPQPLISQRIEAIVGALSEQSPNHPEFAPIPAVAEEVTEIEAQNIGAKVLLNEAFQEIALQTAVKEVPFPIVHLATHGQFSSKAEDTFILTWDDRLNVNELSELLQTSELTRGQPIELLILSACETAAGDDRAALGLAGVAVRAGARSTLASLWVVDDVATSSLIGQFYQALSHSKLTKAQAIRQAQLSLLQQPQYASPYYWAPFVLVGNWL